MRTRATILWLCAALACTAGCSSAARRREAERLRYENGIVELRHRLEGGVLTYETTKLGNTEARLELQLGGGAARSFSAEEEQRLRAALFMLEHRRVSDDPFPLLAELELGPRYGMLYLTWLENDNDTAGIIVKELLPDGQVLRETYALFLCLPQPVRESYSDRLLKTISFQTTPLKPPEGFKSLRSLAAWEDWYICMRTGEQRKDPEEWARFLAASPDQRNAMTLPAVWISPPNRRAVAISIYDSAGHVSPAIPLVLLGSE